MNTKNKTLLASLGLLVSLVPFQMALAAYGLEQTAGAAGLASGKYPSDIPTLVGNVIGTGLSMIAVVFFVLMIYGGFLWMTARGDSGQVDKAKDTIIAAIIGIIVVLASYAITNFVFSAAQGTGNAPPQAGPAGGPQICCKFTTNDGGMVLTQKTNENDCRNSFCADQGEPGTCTVNPIPDGNGPCQ